MRRMFIIIAGIIITILLIVITVFSGVGGIQDPIQPDDNPEPDPDPEPGEPVFTISEPSTNPYLVPETGSHHFLDFSGTIDTLEDIDQIRAYWHDYISYGNSPSYLQFDWHCTPKISRLAPGSHTLRIVAMNGQNARVAQKSTQIVIPDHWKYVFDTDNIPNFDGECWRSEDYYLCFGMPSQETISLGGSGWYWLQGEITHLSGSFYLDNAYGTSHDIWLNIWNGETQTWKTVKNDVMCNSGDGWVNFDVDIESSWGNWVSIAGYPEDQITECDVQVTVTPGTCDYVLSPLSGLATLFFNDQGSLFSPPHPQ